MRPVLLAKASRRASISGSSPNCKHPQTDYPRVQAAQDIAKAGLPAESALRLLSPAEFRALTQ